MPRGAINHRKVLQWVAIWDIALRRRRRRSRQPGSRRHRAAQTTLTIGIGTQDTTTNTVTTGTIIRELTCWKNICRRTGKYANIKFEVEWQNFTSGPPVTNGMMANNSSSA